MAVMITQFAIACLSASSALGKNYGKKLDPEGPYSHITSPLPHEDPSFLVSSIPSSWDWRDVDGVDFTSANMQQHAPGPEYCGACYAFAAISHLNDRFNVARRNAWPTTRLSVQVLITCGSSAPDGCNGGDVSGSLKFIHDYGVPDESCHSYQAQSLQCNAVAVCQDCMTGYDPVCWARKHFPIFRIKEYGQILPKGNVSDVDPQRRQAVIADMGVRMKAEIWKRGPIICQLACPDPIKGMTDVWHDRGYVDNYTPFFNDMGANYEPFILNDKNYTCIGGDWNKCVDHDVVVSGWGEENGQAYWIVRNSWGTWWGEGGWFRIVMGVNNLGIESRCDFGVPDVDGLHTNSKFQPHLASGTPEMFADRFAKPDPKDDKDHIMIM